VASTFGPVRSLHLVASVHLDGAVYGSPVVSGSRTFVATENDSVYAFDSTGHQLWRRSLGSPAQASELPCGNIHPLGITGTPIVQSGVVYAAAELGGPPRHVLYAVDAATGSVRWHRSLDFSGVQTSAMQQRGALTIAGGRVWVPFGGLEGDCGGYKGRVVGIPLSGSGTALRYTVPTAREAGIWTTPGPTVTGSGDLLVAVGNGAAGPGDPYDDSDSVLKISSTTASLLGFFAPSSWAQENASDADLGSQGPALVGPWVFQAGKSGTAYVLRLDRLGGIGGQVSSAPLCHSFGGTAVDGDVVYVPCTDGIRAVRIDTTGHLKVLWHAASSITGSPVVGGGRVWALDISAGVLHGLDPATGSTRKQLNVGAVPHFATAALSGTHILIGTLSGLAIVGVS
jgi:outer membrane protein assembly factor BamB